MLNFGMHELRVVNPECDILSETATTLAVGSVEILRNAKVYSSLAECVADLDIVVATTSRKHSINQIIQTPGEAAAEMIHAKNTCNAGIVFGRERSGLTGEELALANRRVAIPSFKHFGVLNMAQAVNILAYECWSRKLAVEESLDGAAAADEGAHIVSSDISSSVSSSPSGAGVAKEHDLDALVTSGELSAFMQRLLEAMGRSRRYGKVSAAESAAGQGAGEEGRSSNVATEHDGISGLTKKNERRLATVFQRANMNKAELRLMQGMLARLVD
jgi:TrmH family RNA methyltransferase